MGSYPYRDALGEELVRAVRRHRQRAPRRTVIALAMAGAALLASAAAVWLVLGGSDSATTRLHPVHPSHQEGLTLDAPMIPHNGLDRTTFAAAQRDAQFTLLVPDDPAANLENMTGVFSDRSGTTIQLEFPPPDETSKDLRQPYISVYEDSSPGNWATPSQDISHNPDVGKTLCEIEGQPGICVAARSPSDATKSNPAYIRTVIDHTTVELSGGDDLDLLQRIGNTMTVAAAPTH